MLRSKQVCYASLFTTELAGTHKHQARLTTERLCWHMVRNHLT